MKLKNPSKKILRTVSIVTPAFNESRGVHKFYSEVSQACAGLPVTISFIFVDDGSTDDTWEQLTSLAIAQENVRAVKLSRNFGKEAALVAGLSQVETDAAIVLDSDLQHSPNHIPEMIELWTAGYEVVEAVKTSRNGQRSINRFASRSFNNVFKKLTEVDLQNATDYRLLSKKALDALLSMGEQALFFRGTSTWIGFKRVRIEVEINTRELGDSKWTFSALFRLGINALTGFTTAPLHLMTIASVIFALFSVLLISQTLWSLSAGRSVDGYATVLITLLILGSIVTLGLGIIGEYLARIYDETRKRPRFIVDEVVE